MALPIGYCIERPDSQQMPGKWAAGTQLHKASAQIKQGAEMARARLNEIFSTFKGKTYIYGPS
jgi:hypothetical protein